MKLILFLILCNILLSNAAKKKKILRQKVNSKLRYGSSDGEDVMGDIYTDKSSDGDDQRYFDSGNDSKEQVADTLGNDMNDMKKSIFETMPLSLLSIVQAYMGDDLSQKYQKYLTASYEQDNLEKSKGGDIKKSKGGDIKKSKGGDIKKSKGGDIKSMKELQSMFNDPLDGNGVDENTSAINDFLEVLQIAKDEGMNESELKHNLGSSAEAPKTFQIQPTITIIRGAIADKGLISGEVRDMIEIRQRMQKNPQPAYDALEKQVSMKLTDIESKFVGVSPTNQYLKELANADTAKFRKPNYHSFVSSLFKDLKRRMNSRDILEQFNKREKKNYVEAPRPLNSRDSPEQFNEREKEKYVETPRPLDVVKIRVPENSVMNDIITELKELSPELLYIIKK